MREKQNKGVTLIALVITIIVLLILAGVSMNVIFGDNSLFEKAQQAKEETQNSVERENDQLSQIVGLLNNGYLGGLKRDGSWNGTVNTPKTDGTGLQPVYWNGTTWVKLTNESTQEEWNKWYDYANQKWANAQTKDGSLWVWIPRYEYKIDKSVEYTTLEGYKSYKIDVKFIPTSQTTADSGYTYIHPAFRDGRKTNEQIENGEIPFGNGEWDAEIPGFWVAKYEAGFQKSTTNESGEVINGADELKFSDKNYTKNHIAFTTNALSQDLSSLNVLNQKLSYPVFKPLTYAYNAISTGDSYTIAQEIDSATEFYGLNASAVDSHMTKNSEWGAVAYLTQSSYGRNGTEVTINSKDLNDLNNLKIYAVTGYAGDSTPNGVTASSTNNMTGVFDLNGGTMERVAAYVSNGDVILRDAGSSYASAASNLNGYKTLSTRYATVYPYTLNDSNTNNWAAYKTANYGYGDAVLETSTSGNGFTSWNGDSSSFPNMGYPFIMRGGNCRQGVNAGIFALYPSDGYPYNCFSFRAVLVGV